MKTQERVTLKKLAEILGLDVSSVSLALRDSPKISARTKQQVHELARQYCYSPNMAARQLLSWFYLTYGAHLVACRLGYLFDRLAEKDCTISLY